MIDWTLFDGLDFGDLEVPEGAVVLDAIVVARYQAPEDECPAFTFTSTTYDTALKIGILDLMSARLKDSVLTQWREDD